MKKIITFATVAIFAACITSCEKTDSLAGTNPVPPSGTNLPAGSVKMVSTWLSLSFTPVSKSIGSVLAASTSIPGIYVASDDMAFAYVRVGNKGAVVHALPATFANGDGLMEIFFNIDNSSFSVTAKDPQNSTNILSSATLDSYGYRFIIVSNDFYQQHSNLDWSDYSKVATALGLAD